MRLPCPVTPVPASAKPKLEDTGLSVLTVKELKTLGGRLGLTHLSKLKKNQLIALIAQKQAQLEVNSRELYTVAA